MGHLYFLLAKADAPAGRTLEDGIIRGMTKESSKKLTKLAARIIKTGRCTKAEAQSLAGSVLVQFEDEERAIAGWLIDRLNKAIRNRNVRADVELLISSRVRVSKATLDHPTIQCDGADNSLGFLGMLNGLVGNIKGGKFDRWGYIAAVYAKSGRLLRFEYTDKRRRAGARSS